MFRKLGYTINDSEWLKVEYERQAKQNYLKGDYIVRGLGEYGQDINIVIDLISPTGRSVQFISGWKVHPLGYLTCNTPHADD